LRILPNEARRCGRTVLIAAVAGLLVGGQPAPKADAVEQPPIASARPPDAANATWQKRWWIDKTARLLRGGEGLGPRDDLAALMKLPEDTIVRMFMNDVRFGDSILDFNMYFLGFKLDWLKSGGIYRRAAFDFSNAVASAQALLKDGDYLKLFDLEGPYYLPPLPTVPDDPPKAEDAGLPLPALRLKAIEETKQVFLKLAGVGGSEGTRNPGAACQDVNAILEDSPAIFGRLNRAFNDEDVFIVMMRGHVLIEPLDILAHAYRTECVDKPAGQADAGRQSAAALEALDRFSRAFTEILKFEPARYKPKTVLDFKPFDLSVFKVDRWLAFGFEQSTALKNSSTNFNRRRGAYVLKHFFCDDLTPVGFENPKDHVTGVHGSDTPCFACHFKLDPMAGFFRDRGTYFYDYAKNDTIIFDDGVEADRQKYSTNWQAQKGAPRSWNTGYIRSPRFDEQNSYGETIADLSHIIRDAPEAKRCLMKRLFEYMVAEEQTIDGAWLDELTQTFAEEAAHNSSLAMKNAIVRIATSNAYHQVNADPQQCYDHVPGARLDNAPPCRVASILQKNCVQCHGGSDPVARLDLSAWVPAPDGKSRTFPHFDAGHRQIAPQETLGRLAERLSSTDPAVRMPKDRAMPDQERQELFLWAQGLLARSPKTGAR
jgi:hypothetical protein